MTLPLEATQSAIRAHWELLNSDLAELARAGGPRASVSGEFLADRAFALFRGPEAEEAARQRGRALVIPLGEISVHGSRYWVAYLEEWNFVERASYRFRTSGLTFFQGAHGEYEKIQLFRAEWPGFTDWGDGKPGWQAEGAGHPHWQFDALNMYASREARENDVGRLLNVLHQAGEIEEFGAENIPTVRELAFQHDEDLHWTKMHFASQAKWSRSPWHGDRSSLDAHAHAPVSLTEVRAWLISVIYYVWYELKR